MTIIAYRAGILAADTAAWRGDYVSGSVRKICRMPDGGLGAAAGSVTIMRWFLNWLESGGASEARGTPPADPDGHGFGGLVVRPNGDLFACDLNVMMYPIKAEWFALGRSSGFTAGCLAAGASAEEAVKLTLKWTDAGHGHIDVEYLDPARVGTKAEASLPEGWPPGISRSQGRAKAWAEYERLRKDPTAILAVEG